jgi:hypothetical protein
LIVPATRRAGRKVLFQPENDASRRLTTTHPPHGPLPVFVVPSMVGRDDPGDRVANLLANLDSEFALPQSRLILDAVPAEVFHLDQEELRVEMDGNEIHGLRPVQTFDPLPIVGMFIVLDRVPGIIKSKAEMTFFERLWHSQALT